MSAAFETSLLEMPIQKPVRVCMLELSEFDCECRCGAHGKQRAADASSRTAVPGASVLLLAPNRANGFAFFHLNFSCVCVFLRSSV